MRRARSARARFTRAVPARSARASGGECLCRRVFRMKNRLLSRSMGKFRTLPRITAPHTNRKPRRFRPTDRQTVRRRARQKHQTAECSNHPRALVPDRCSRSAVGFMTRPPRVRTRGEARNQTRSCDEAKSSRSVKFGRVVIVSIQRCGASCAPSRPFQFALKWRATTHVFVSQSRRCACCGGLCDL